MLKDTAEILSYKEDSGITVHDLSVNCLYHRSMNGRTGILMILCNISQRFWSEDPFTLKKFFEHHKKALIYMSYIYWY